MRYCEGELSGVHWMIEIQRKGHGSKSRDLWELRIVTVLWRRCGGRFSRKDILPCGFGGTRFAISLQAAIHRVGGTAGGARVQASFFAGRTILFIFPVAQARDFRAAGRTTLCARTARKRGAAINTGSREEDGLFFDCGAAIVTVYAAAFFRYKVRSAPLAFSVSHGAPSFL